MELRTLKTFIKVAELLNFSKAAEALGYTQSTVSVHIGQLETELHTRLFERFGKNVRLTARASPFCTMRSGSLKRNGKPPIICFTTWNPMAL